MIMQAPELQRGPTVEDLLANPINFSLIFREKPCDCQSDETSGVAIAIRLNVFANAEPSEISPISIEKMVGLANSIGIEKMVGLTNSAGPVEPLPTEKKRASSELVAIASTQASIDSQPMEDLRVKRPKRALPTLPHTLLTKVRLDAKTLDFFFWMVGGSSTIPPSKDLPRSWELDFLDSFSREFESPARRNFVRKRIKSLLKEYHSSGNPELVKSQFGLPRNPKLTDKKLASLIAREEFIRPFKDFCRKRTNRMLKTRLRISLYRLATTAAFRLPLLPFEIEILETLF